MDESDPKNFLEELHKEKKTIEKYIRQLEESIIENEKKYLESTVNGGNILRGWEHIFTSKSNKIHMGNQGNKKNHISNNEKLFSQTFEFDKNSDEIINTTDKITTQNNTINNNSNNIKIESPKSNNTSHITNNYKHKNTIKKSLGTKRKRNNNNDFSQNDKLEPKNS